MYNLFHLEILISISEIATSKSNKIINIDILGRESKTNKIKLIKTKEGAIKKQITIN